MINERNEQQLGPQSFFSEGHQQRDFLKEGNDFNGSYY